MAISLKAISIQNAAGSRKKRITYACTFSGNYSTGGDTVDITGVTQGSSVDPNFLGARIPQGAPDFIEVNGAPGGNSAEIVLGSGNNNSKLKQFTAGATELGAGPYPAGVTADTNVSITVVYPQKRA